MRSLSPEQQKAFWQAFEQLLSDPFPDGDTKVPLGGFPYREGTYGATIGGFWITYTFLNAATLAIGAVYWSPDSPHHPMSH